MTEPDGPGDICLGHTSLYKVNQATVLRSGMLIPFQISQDLCVQPLQGPVPSTLFLTRDATDCPTADTCVVLGQQVAPDLPDPLPRGALACGFTAALPLMTFSMDLHGSRTVTILHSDTGFTAHVREQVGGNTFYTGSCQTTYELVATTP